MAQVKGQEGNHFVVKGKLDTAPEAWWRPGMSGIVVVDAGKENVTWIFTHRLVDTLRMSCGGWDDGHRMSTAVFSDSWFRIAQARVSLPASTKVERQNFGGELWYVLQDSYSHRYFRITPQAYAFISRLTPEKTVEASWLEFIATHPDAAPGQEDVVRVLSQLHVANMLYFQDLPDNQAIYRRAQTQRRRELQSKLMGFLYTRIYLFDPDRCSTAGRVL